MPGLRIVTERLPRDRQRGNSLVLALIVMSALATLGSLTVVSVQSSLKASTNDRSQAVALYAAESGAAYAMDFLRSLPVGTDWSQYLSDATTTAILPVSPDPLFPTNHALPGSGDNPFSVDQNAWFEIQFFNDHSETPASPPKDSDHRVIIRSTGHGPQESIAVVEWEVRMYTPPGPFPPPLPAPNPAPGGPVFVLIGWHVVDL